MASRKTTQQIAAIAQMVMAIVMAIVVLMGVAYLIIAAFVQKEWDPAKWVFSSGNNDKTASLLAITADGEEMHAGGEYAMPAAFTIVTAPPSSSPFADKGEFTLVASLSNKYINGSFEFNCYFSDDANAWATGTNASDYISVTPVEGSSDKATIKLLDGFGAPIEIKATLKGSDKSATCRVDYLQRIYFNTSDLFSSGDFGDGNYVEVGIIYDIGTVKGDECKVAYCNFMIEENFISKFKSYLKFDVTVKPYAYSSDAVVEFGDTWLKVKEPDSPEWEYSMFIEGFNDFDEQHKNAIYYAWHTAYRAESKESYRYTNLLLDIGLRYIYSGKHVQYLTESDLRIDGPLTGYNYAEDISPDVELNGNITF